MTKATGFDQALADYIHAQSVREPAILAELRERTARVPKHFMQVSADEGQFLRLLVRLSGAKRIVEVGTFTGYSALSMAMALPEDGELIACDIDPDVTKIAREYWDKAGLGDRMHLELGPALDTLDQLIAAGEAGTFDMAFIDADKGNYQNYFERTLELVRTGGLICVDNVLWGGNVARPDVMSEDTVALRAFNEALKDDARVEMSMLAIADGLSLAIKL